MIEITWIPEFIQGIVWVYIVIWVGCVIWAFVGKKTISKRFSTLFFVMVLFGALPVYLAVNSKKYNSDQRSIVEKNNKQLAAATARFEERCRTAGEKIYQTANDVDGIFLKNIRKKSSSADWSDPDWPDAGLPNELPEEDYIKTFLYWEHHEDKRNMRGYLNESPSSLPGYKFVDVSTQDGIFKRFQLLSANKANLTFEKIAGSQLAKYEISFENINNPEDRKFWVAGAKVTIFDESTKKIMAEKIWYAIDLGQGNTNEFRSPWKTAKICPFHVGASDGATRFFVDQVLKPKMGE